MKKTFLSLLLATITVATALAYDFEVNGIYYKKNNSNSNEVTVTCKDNNFNSYQGDVVIPDSVVYQNQTYRVSIIGLNAFRNCTDPLTVVIPNSVKTIDSMAFFRCHGLNSVTIGDSVTSIGGSCFSGCENLTEVYIPSSVTSIGSSAFSGCTNLITVTLPEQLTTIEQYTFYSCEKLDNVFFPGSLKTIGNRAYAGCKSISSLNIPSSITTIGESAFSWDHGLTDLTISNPSIVIETSAFSYCSNLVSVLIDNTNAPIDGELGRIGENAFKNCRALTNLDLGSGLVCIGRSAFEQCDGLQELIIPNTIKSIGARAFLGCTGLIRLSLGNTVDSIGEYSFSKCGNLTSLTIPESVAYIHHLAFDNCSGLESIQVEHGNPIYDSRDNCNAIIERATNTLVKGCKNSIIPYTVEAIGSCAFANCMGLSSVEIPTSVTSIRYNAFIGCSDLASVSVSEGNQVYDSRDNCNAIIETESNSLLLGCKNTIIPEAVTIIGDYAFSGCIDIKKIVIPSSVNSIGYNAFKTCLLDTIICKAITPPTAYNSFKDYNAILLVPYESINEYRCALDWESFTTIKAYDLEETHCPYINYDCAHRDYVEVTIVNSDEDPDADIYYRIESYATGTSTEWMLYTESLLFYDKGETYTIEAFSKSEGKTESEHVISSFTVEFHDPYLIQVADFCVDGVYYKITSDSTVEVSINYLYDYSYAEPWGWEQNAEASYSGDVVIPAVVEYAGNTYTVEGIGNIAFINSELTSITLPDGLKRISNRAFIHATVESGSLFIPASVTTIETGAFAGFYDLTTVQVDENNPIYDSRDNCNAIIETATNTLVAAFNSTTVPSTVAAIGKDAFAGDVNSGCGYYIGCTISDLLIPNSVKEIADRAFYISNISNISLSEELTTIGNWAFFENTFTRLIIPNSVTTIGVGAFAQCRSMTSVIISNSVTTIEDQTFKECSSLVSVNITSSVISIGKEAFTRTNLTSLNIPNSVVLVGEEAFSDCEELTKVTIGNSVASIGTSAFSYAKKLGSIICHALTPPSARGICNSYYGNTYEQAKLFVPAESVSAYRSHEEWGKFTCIVPFVGAGPGDINGDGNIAINDVTNLIDMLLSGDELPAWTDVNGDGAINVKDITDLIDMLLSGH